MRWKLSGKQDVYLEIASRYKEYISMGLLQEGEKLPSVRMAAGELGVNPNTVAKAAPRIPSSGAPRLPKMNIQLRETFTMREER